MRVNVPRNEYVVLVQRRISFGKPKKAGKEPKKSRRGRQCACGVFRMIRNRIG